jgi:putative colanic acid biosynthesis acetyltransferase WcaF
MTYRAPEREKFPDYQRLKEFQLPKDFRGRSAAYVQFWWLVQETLFGLSPQFMFGWRRFLLRQFGARIGKGVKIRPTARITYPWKVSIGDWSWVGDHVVLYSLSEIQIGANVVVSQNCYLCSATHDYRTVTFDMIAGPILIEAETWLAADVFVGPNVSIGRAAVVGARSSVFGDLGGGYVYFGSPARQIRRRDSLAGS